MRELYRAHDDCCEHERLADLQTRLSAAEEALAYEREEYHKLMMSRDAMQADRNQAEAVVELYREYYAAHQVVEDGVASFDLHHDAVTRLENAASAIRQYEAGR